MTAPEARTPVIVGAAVVANRSDEAGEPIALMEAATRAALADAGVGGAVIDMVRVVRGVWPYADPGRIVAGRIGASSAVTSLGVIGGNEMLSELNRTVQRVQDGEVDTVVICAAEALRTRRRARRDGGEPVFIDEAPGAVADEPPAETRPHAQGREITTGAAASAVAYYGMVETALRHAAGESTETHRRRIAHMWARASAVAADNPDAWLQRAHGAEEIATVSDRNRMISSPYPKLMTSNIDVDQGGAVVVMSVEAARRLGVTSQRWVFPHAGVDAADHWFASNRWSLDRSPAMGAVGRQALELAGVGIDDCRFVDVYSCFPSAVQVAQRELGLSPNRDFTITGGLTFAGGPLNCYCMLSLVRAVQLLRDDPGERALLTGNGGFFTKHSCTVLAGSPGHGYRSASVQAEIDTLPRRQEATQPPAVATVEAYTVGHDRGGEPQRSTLSCLTADGTRWWAATDDDDVARALLDDDMVGAPVDCTGDGVRLA